MILGTIMEFLKSHTLGRSEKCAAIVPECSESPSFNILKGMQRDRRKSEYALWIRKPLYGSRVAPHRRLVRISERFRIFGYRQYRLDVLCIRSAAQLIGSWDRLSSSNWATFLRHRQLMVAKTPPGNDVDLPSRRISAFIPR